MPDLKFLTRLSSGPPLLLDGATGTELERRGFPLTAPGWSASAIREAPELLKQIHSDYVEAGSRILTANTFRTHARNLIGTPWEGSADQLTNEAVQIARSASRGKAYIAGSIAPLGDCYTPAATPLEKALEQEHREMVQRLCDAGVDLILVETQITILEAVTIAHICAEMNVPYLLSFTCRQNGRLLSGEPLTGAVEEVLPHKPAGLLVNCLPVEEVDQSLQVLAAQAPDVPRGAYANTGRLRTDGTWESTAGHFSAVYAEFARSWKELDCQLFGGCCGTSPDHIKRLSESL